MTLRPDGYVDVHLSVSGEEIAGTYRVVEGERDGYADQQLQGAGNGLVFRSFWHSGCRGI